MVYIGSHPTFYVWPKWHELRGRPSGEKPKTFLMKSLYLEMFEKVSKSVEFEVSTKSCIEIILLAVEIDLRDQAANEIS